MAKLRNVGIILALVFCVAILCGCPGEHDITSIISSIVTDSENEPGDGSGEDNNIVPPPGDKSEEENGEDAPDFPVLDKETEMQIRQTLADRGNAGRGGKTKESFPPIAYCYGIYNGYVVISLNYSPIAAIWTEVVDGIGFMEIRHPGIKVWKGDNIYTLTELYEQGQLTREDLLSIQTYNIQKREYEKNGGVVPDFPVLDEETEAQIRQTLADLSNAGRDGNKIEFLPPIAYCYGTYNGYVVISLDYSPVAAIWTEVVDGIGFMEIRHPGIKVWKDDNIFTLTELYEQGQLTREDLLSIQAYNIQRRAYDEAEARSNK